MRITLTATEGPHAGKVFAFRGHDTFIVGRSKKAHFRLATADRYFSRIHFLVEVNPPRCVLMDMGSRNGTYVNGERVQRAALKDGDQIRAGKTVLQIAVSDADSQSPTDPPPGVPAETLDPAAAPPQPPGVAAAAAAVSQSPAAAAPRPGPARLAAARMPRTTPGPPSRPPALPTSPSPLGGSHSLTPRPDPPPQEGRGPELAPTPTVGLSACRACLAPLDETGSVAGSAWLCAGCDALARGTPQPIPGYLQLRKLGQGAMGIVWLAVRTEDGLPVAVKTITPAVAGSPAQVQRFLREADILRQLDHPHIVAFRDLGEAEGMLYFAMDYVRGRDAGRILKKDGPLSVRRAVTLACQLLDGLAYAHARGFVHRDIKPSNVLVAEEAGRETVKVVDFGLARVYQASQLSGLTLTGDIGGTMAFMPPEQITEYREARPPADQYAAAATLYNLLTGAYVHNLPAEFHNQILVVLQDDPVPIRDRRADLPAGLAAAIHRALAREPAERFPDVAAFREALRPFAD